MRLKAVLICAIFSLTVLPITPADAQVGAPAVDLMCMSLDSSGAVDIEVYPGANLTGHAYCTVSNPNSYQEKIDIQVTADGLVVAHPSSITLGPNAEEEFTVTVKADERKDQEKEEEVEARTTTTTMPPIKIHILDVVNQKWYIPKNVGDYAPTNRSGHGAELWGGQVVLTGGYDNSDKGAIDRTSRLVKTDAERLVVL